MQSLRDILKNVAMGDGKTLVSVGDTVLGSGNSSVYPCILKETVNGVECEREAAVKCVYMKAKEGLKQCTGPVSEELKIWENLPGNENVVALCAGKIVEVGDAQKELVALYVTEKMDMDLKRLIFEDDKFGRNCTYWDLLDIFEQICKGLMHLHDNKVIHHDLKPKNVLISRKDGKIVVQVADFGGSKCIESGRKSVTASQRGTVNYMAPEVRALSPFRDRNITITSAIDVYSLGALMWEVLNRTQPENMLDYNSPVGQEISWGSLSGEAKVWCTAPEPLCTLVEKCLSFKKLEDVSSDYGRPSVKMVLASIVSMKNEKLANWRAQEYQEVGIEYIQMSGC